MKIIFVCLIIVIASSNSISCQQGFVLNYLNICIEPQYIEGCSRYMSKKSCQVCDYRYQLLPNGLCQINDLTNTECCTVKNPNNSCASCPTGFYLINGSCQESNLIGCLQKNSKGICINCANDYLLSDGKCQKSIKGCREYINQTNLICSICNSGYSLINNICIQSSILGCKNQINQICKECFNPFILINGNCEILNCKIYNDYGCVACQCGFYLSFNGICKPMEKGCIRYQRQKCIDCLPNYRLSENRCQIQGCTQMNGIVCTACQVNYSLVNGGCSLKNCLSWKSGSCEICKAGFSYKAGQCIQDISLLNA